MGNDLIARLEERARELADFPFDAYVTTTALLREAAADLTAQGEIAPAPVDDETRCAICAWPYAATRVLGCRPGDCSMRPFPPHLYAPARAQRDYAGRLDMSRFTNGNPLAAASPVPAPVIPPCILPKGSCEYAAAEFHDAQAAYALEDKYRDYERWASAGDRLERAWREVASPIAPAAAEGHPELVRLRAWVRSHMQGNWTCHVLSLGDKCQCPLCDIDRLAAASPVPAAEEDEQQDDIRRELVAIHVEIAQHDHQPWARDVAIRLRAVLNAMAKAAASPVPAAAEGLDLERLARETEVQALREDVKSQRDGGSMASAPRKDAALQATESVTVNASIDPPVAEPRCTCLHRRSEHYGRCQRPGCPSQCQGFVEAVGR